MRLSPETQVPSLTTTALKLGGACGDDVAREVGDRAVERFSIGSVVRSVRYSAPVMPSACTVKVSSSPSRRLAAAPGCLAFSEVASRSQLLLGQLGVAAVPGIPHGTAHAGVQHLRQMLDHVAPLVLRQRWMRARAPKHSTSACRSTGSPASATCAASSTTGARTTTTTGRTAPSGTCRRPCSPRVAASMLTATRQTPHHLLRCKPLGSRSKCYETWGQRRIHGDLGSCEAPPALYLHHHCRVPRRKPGQRLRYSRQSCLDQNELVLHVHHPEGVNH